MRIENKINCSGYNRKNSKLLEIYEYILRKFLPIFFFSVYLKMWNTDKYKWIGY